jgi:hypothetical protein
LEPLRSVAFVKRGVVLQTRRRAGSIHALITGESDTVRTRNQIAGVGFVGKSGGRILLDFHCGFCDMLHHTKSAFEGTRMTFAQTEFLWVDPNRLASLEALPPRAVPGRAIIFDVTITGMGMARRFTAGGLCHRSRG